LSDRGDSRRAAVLAVSSECVVPASVPCAWPGAKATLLPGRVGRGRRAGSGLWRGLLSEERSAGFWVVLVRASVAWRRERFAVAEAVEVVGEEESESEPCLLC